MAIRPLQWDLKQLSRDDIALQQAIHRFFPSATVRSAVTTAIRKTLIENLGQEVLFFQDDIETVRFGEFAEELGDAAILVVIGAPPAKQQLYLHLDNDLAGMLIDRLLGGSGDRGAEPIALSETEQGVLQYLVMQCLAALHSAVGRESQYHFRFHRILVVPKAQAEALAPSASVAVVNWRFGLGERMGRVRLALPAELVTAVQSQAQLMQGPESVSPQQAGRFKGERMRLWVDAGQCTLTPADVAGLDTGDVVLFDRTELRLEKGKPVGEVVLRLGTGEHGGLRAELKSGKKLACVVEGYEEGRVIAGK